MPKLWNNSVFLIKKFARCRHHSRVRKCPLHDFENVEKVGAEIEETSKKGNVNQTSTQKSNEEMYRAFLGELANEFGICLCFLLYVMIKDSPFNTLILVVYPADSRPLCLISQVK